MKLGFRAKVLLAIAATTMCASILIGVIYFRQSQREIESNYMQALWRTMSVTMSALDENVRQAYDTAVALNYDETLAALTAQYDGTEVEQGLALSGYLRQYGQRVDNLRNVYLYLPAHAQTITSEEYHAVEPTAAGTNTWLTDGAAQGSLAPRLVYDGISRAPVYMLSYCSRSGANAPVVSVNLDERRLFYQYLDEIDADGTGAFYLVDSTGTIVSATNQRDIGRLFAIVSGVGADVLSGGQDELAVADGAERLVAAVRSPLTGFSLVSVSDRRALTASLTQQRNFIFGFLFLVVLAMLVPAYHMAGRVYAPVRQLKDAMQKVSEGDLSARAEVHSTDEIGQLGIGFNEMVCQIESLIDDLVSEQMQKKEAELEALQYQITPHFMYNTLNSIKYAAILQGNQAVGDQLTAFIELLQASIRRSGAFITVRDETRMVQNYVKLQQFRYADSFTVAYDLSPEAENCCVPRLILQPLVENAILHGQKQSGEPCRITVSTALVTGTLVLSVQDAGDGMTREQIGLLMQGQKAGKGGFSGIGIPNIIERLRLYYGDAASLQYTSSEHGTKAVILLPATTDPEAYII